MLQTASDFYIFVGNKIKEKRQELGLAQKDIAEILNITVQRMQAFESGNSSISFLYIYKIAHFTNVDITYFCKNFKNEQKKKIIGKNEKMLILLKRSLKDISITIDYLREKIIKENLNKK